MRKLLTKPLTRGAARFLKALFASQFSKYGTFKSLNGTAFSQVTRRNVTSYTSYAVRVLEAKNFKKINSGPMPIEGNIIDFLIPISGIPEVKTGDILIVGGKSYKVANEGKMWGDTAYALSSESVATNTTTTTTTTTTSTTSTTSTITT